MNEALLETNIPALGVPRRGKVRDNYDLGDTLLIVATDRISAFDSVMPNGIPDKGRILTQLSRFWFEFTRALSPNHLLTTDVSAMGLRVSPSELDQLRGRTTLGRKARVIPVECVVRGYLAGSGWKEYRRSGTVCGVRLPAGLRESERLPEPIFTPSTKAETGHDESIPFAEAEKVVGERVASYIRDKSIGLYEAASRHAAKCGILLADTKFEWGQCGEEIILIDEVLTPDSSRFWPADRYVPGGPQPSFDKQYVRDYLEKIGWDKEPPAPRLPDDVVEATRAKYLEALRMLTGSGL